MAFSVRPALFCILLWLALSQEAAPEAKKGAKCKNPKVTWVLKDSISSSSLSGIWGRWVLQGLLQVHLCQNLKEILSSLSTSARHRVRNINTWQATLAPLLCVAMVFAVKVYCVDLIGYWLIWSVVLQSCWCYFSLCGLNVCNINNINNIWRTTLHTRITSNSYKSFSVARSWLGKVPPKLRVVLTAALSLSIVHNMKVTKTGHAFS